jgi:DnaD/phage-associated family protein
MISAELFEDDLIGTMAMINRLVWIGLITAVADDQGRMLDNTAIIRARVFPYDRDITDETIERCLAELADNVKVFRYQVGNKRMIQIARWWRYQTPSWASPSKYPAPAGWVDRCKYHAAGNKIITANWDRPGGFSEVPSGQPSRLSSVLSSGINEGEGEGEVKGDGEVKADLLPPENFTKAESKAAEAVPNVYTVYESNIGILTPHIAEKLKAAEDQYPPGWIERAIQISAENNARRWSYIESILDRWRVSGFDGDRKNGNGKKPVRIDLEEFEDVTKQRLQNPI